MRKLSIYTCCLFCIINSSLAHSEVKYAILISANMEWKSVKKNYPNEKLQTSPWGEYFFKDIAHQNILFFQEGWGKVAAAGATQYVIDQFKPIILINLGTCGGFEGEIERQEVVLADKTIIYDILEAMGDSKEAIADYTTNIDLSWLGKTYPVKVRKTTLVSADKDLRTEEIEKLKKEYHAVAGDWESGAIAYTAAKNKKKVVILRGVSDLVSSTQSEAHGNMNLFEERAHLVMTQLLKDLPLWIEHIEKFPK
jgi:adenosylhomocysteine nucleosidase